MNILCSVDGCIKTADYEVQTYWWSPYPEEEALFEPDAVCPYICHEHMLENEEKKIQDRKYVNYCHYPFTKADLRHGRSEYKPLDSIHNVLYECPRELLAVSNPAPELLSAIRNKPEILRTVEPRQFEQLVATILENHGFNIELTPITRDGGVDIMAWRNEPLGRVLYVVECKRYVPPRKVGIDVVQRVYGVTLSHGANKGVVVTTSTFTADAKRFAVPLKYLLSLHDYERLVELISSLKSI